MNRREFLRLTGLGAGTLVLPLTGRLVTAEELLAPDDVRTKKILADIALNAATKAGATYADARIGRYLRQFVITREDKVGNIINTESSGIGIRVISNGTWGFAATSTLEPDAIARAAQQAVAIGKANSKFQEEPVQLASVKGVGEVSWQTPTKKNALEVPLADKIDMLMEVNKAALDNGASFVNSTLFLVNEKKYFASTDGSYVDQDIHRLWAPMTVTAVDKKTGKFRTRNGLSEPMGMGWEYFDGRPEDKVPGPATRYDRSYDMVEDAVAAAGHAQEKLTARSVEPGKYTLVLDPSHLWLTIHESVGHPLELDRVLGYEANYAGTSFATLDKWRSKKFNFGSPIVNFYADKTQRDTLAAVAYDDEGVKTKEWDLVKDGILVNYQAIRDQVHILGEEESHGCCHADSWSSVQFQRMPNVSLKPGVEKHSIDDMIGDVEDGIYIIGRGSYSIDQQRYNFQFGGQLFYEIKNGEITEMIEDVAYQSNTQDFWNACSRLCDQRDYRLGGSFFDGKGQPGQVSPVSHGCPTARFDDINVINTVRKIG